VHCNDWQTGLIPAHLATRLADEPGYREIATLMTIHNLAYQGHFASHELPNTGLDPRYFNWRQMEFYGHINFLKTGIVFADAISTVSPRYAHEIQTSDHGNGLDSALRERRENLFGLLNGIDAEAWDPQTDVHLPTHYNIENWRHGKRANKTALQQQSGLAVNPSAPLIGLVGRLVSQKGWSLILPVMSHWLAAHDVQWVVLGTGDPAIEGALRELKHRHPDRLALNLGFSNELAHQIEAAADIFLMPSQYEPCGLNQMYSMRYGTVPVVHRTGGLADTVHDVNEHNMANGRANGFAFDQFDPGALESTLGRAVSTFVRQPAVWQKLVEAGMTTDWSWSRSAGRYEQVYQRICAGRANRSVAHE
jgi:starch synthase